MVADPLPRLPRALDIDGILIEGKLLGIMPLGVASKQCAAIVTGVDTLEPTREK